MKKRILLVGCGGTSLLLTTGLMSGRTFEVDIACSEKDIDDYLKGKSNMDEAKRKLAEDYVMKNPSKYICEDIYIKEDKHPFDKFINGRKNKRRR